jgi:hypothetical protein
VGFFDKDVQVFGAKAPFLSKAMAQGWVVYAIIGDAF